MIKEEIEQLISIIAMEISQSDDTLKLASKNTERYCQEKDNKIKEINSHFDVLQKLLESCKSSTLSKVIGAYDLEIKYSMGVSKCRNLLSTFYAAIGSACFCW